jgi:uridine kinase
MTLPLFSGIDERMRRKEYITVAIDGNSAAGKSSLSALLKETYACNVILMDDFFLRPGQRTIERLSEPGGNIDYERFAAEVIKPLRTGKPFTYRPFNCRTGELAAPVVVTPNPLTVIEGVYSLHPRFIEAYDIKVFIHINETGQHRRLSERSPHLLDRFIREWIPMENMYFDAFQIAAQCDFVINGEVV